MDRTLVQRRLLAWFAKHQRPLPWRANREPYRIWVSEIMLQQTQVNTVIAYFERFMRSFPTLADLARASEQEVLRHWEGLGYYRRARDLHRSARLLLSRHEGQFPRDPSVLQGLPGFGRYTTGAVLSQAFDCRLPILEANSRRVLCRLYGLRGLARSPHLEKQLWRHAEELLPSRRSGDFNQGLMELGALVCTVSEPRCQACPLRDQCRARRLRLVDKIPAPLRAAPILRQREIAVIARRGRRVLLVQRPPHGRWPGLWEFPHAPAQTAESATETARRLVADLTGIQAEPGQELTTLRHTVMRFHITLKCLEAGYRSGRFRSDFYSAGRWVNLGELHKYPVSAPQRRLVNALQRAAAP